MDVAVRPLPRPITPETRPFWDGLKAHRLMLPTCRKCGPFFYPRILCPVCHSRQIDWIEASGRGVLYSFEIAYQTLNPAFRIPPPYVLAMVKLQEGPRLMSNLIDIQPDPTTITCGMAVEAAFEKLTADITILLFRPQRPRKATAASSAQ